VGGEAPKNKRERKGAREGGGVGVGRQSKVKGIKEGKEVGWSKKIEMLFI